MNMTIKMLMDIEWQNADVFKANNRKIILMLSNGDTVPMSYRCALFHRIMWEPYRRYNVTITKEQVYFNGLTDKISILPGVLSKIQTKQKEDILNHKPDVDTIGLSITMAECISTLSNVETLYCRHRAQTISALVFNRVLNDENIVKLRNAEFKQDEGTGVAEAKIKVNTEKLIKLLSTPGAMKNNPFLTYMDTKCFKDNQLPQLLLAYGTRDDIDTTMNKTVITNSAITGLQTLEEFACESLATKKSARANSQNVGTVQYGARKLKLAASYIKHLYANDCGTPSVVELKPKPEHLDRWLYKTVVVNGEQLTITKDNYKQLANEVLTFRSPMVCNHHDGVCVQCSAFRNGQFHKWVPPNVHIGEYCCSLHSEIIAQLVLSTKHVHETSSYKFKIGDVAAQYINMKTPDKLLLSKNIESKNLKLLIPTADLGPITDLFETKVNPAEYSNLTTIGLTYEEDITKGKTLISITDDVTTGKIYLSREMLRWMKKLKVESRDGYIIIPMDKWNYSKPAFKYIIYNDDITMRARHIESYVSTHIRNATTVTDALSRYSDLVYAKLNIPIVYLEIILKTFMVKGYNDMNPPTYKSNLPKIDPNNVIFAGRNELLMGRAVSTQLAFEDNMAYISSPSVFNTDRMDGLYDPLFGIAKNGESK